MSIRGFHIIFITIATLLCLGVASWVWFLSGFPDNAQKYGFVGGALIAAIVLMSYGVYYYNKLKKQNF